MLVKLNPPRFLSVDSEARLPGKVKGLLATVAAIGIGILVFVTRPGETDTLEAPTDSLSAESRLKEIAPGGAPIDSSVLDDQSPELENLKQQIADAERRLGAAPALDDSRRLLLNLAKNLDSAKPISAVAAIVDYLHSGRDAQTGLEFVLSPEGGTLEESPTLRAWLMDLLGSLDPVAAASLARAQLSERRSRNGGESALAMRNLVWGSGQPLAGVDRQILQSASLEHVANPKWSADPETGYLEGFDAAVFIPSRAATERLAEIIAHASNPRAMRFAAGLALERIAEVSHADSLAAIAASSLDPSIKGDLLARANPADDDAMRVLEDFLSNADASEAQNFFWRAFPQASRAVGPRLISPETSMADSGQMDRDLMALEVLEGWSNQLSIPQHGPALRATLERLKGHLQM
jgi:hypothetical protein